MGLYTGYPLQLPELPTVDFKWLSAISLPDHNQLEARVFERNPELQRKKIEIERSIESITLAKREFWPDLNLSFNYRIEQPVPQNQFYAGGIAITLPLWDHAQYAIPSARAAANAEDASHENLKIQLKKKFDQAWKRATTSQQELNLFPLKLVIESEKKFDIAELEFRKGRISTSVFIETDSQIHETLDSIYETQYKLIQSLSQLFLMSGEELTL